MHVKGEHIVTLGALGMASANQMDNPCENEDVSSCLEGEHMGELGALGIGGLGWCVPIAYGQFSMCD